MSSSHAPTLTTKTPAPASPAPKTSIKHGLQTVFSVNAQFLRNLKYLVQAPPAPIEVAIGRETSGIGLGPEVIGD
jgi:hypothetical protein